MVTKQNYKRNKNSIEDIEIIGEFEIKVDDRIVAKGKNKWNRYFMSSLIFIAGWTGYVVTTGTGYGYAYLPCNSITARVGTDTSTPTTVNTSDLSAKIDRAPSSTTRRWIRDLDRMQWISQYEFIWNPNVLPSATIGEAGVYLNLTDDSWSSPATSGATINGSGNIYPNPAQRLGIRVSVADGDFSPLSYIYTQTLAFVWRLILRPG